MLTKITIRNFKCFDEVVVDLASPVVFIGPNNSGKTTALQALALWEIGIKRWNMKRKGKTNPEKRPGVTINRRDLVAVPVPSSKFLWRSLHVRDTSKVDGKQETQNIRMDIIVEGITNDSKWICGFEFDYANEESFYCRPLRLTAAKDPDRMPVPEEAGNVNIAFLPPMSGLAANETRLDEGAVKVRVGEGRTAEVLRNLCFKIFQERKECWERGEADFAGPLFIKPIADNHLKIMKECIKDVEKAMEVLGKGSPWHADTKVSDDFLLPLFKKYFETLGLPNAMTKKNFHRLARFVPKDKIDPEVKEKLDAIVQVAKSANPAEEE